MGQYASRYGGRLDMLIITFMEMSVGCAKIVPAVGHSSSSHLSVSLNAAIKRMKIGDVFATSRGKDVYLIRLSLIEVIKE